MGKWTVWLARAPERIAALTGGRHLLLEAAVPHREQSRVVLDVVGQWLRARD